MWQLTFALTLVVATVAVTEITAVSPPICQQCVQNADCVNDTFCQCKTGYVGKERFHCYNPNNSYCHIVSDPMVRTFSGQHFKIHDPGTYQLINTTLDFTGGSNVKCEFLAKVTLATIDNGKYVDEIRFDIGLRTPATSIKNSYRITASLDGDVFVWSIYVLNTVFETTPFLTKRSDMALESEGGFCSIEFLNYKSFFLKTYFSCCGINFGFRQKSNFPSLVPGVFLELDTAHNPEWTPDDGSLCTRTY